jgi:hypothetical protein
LKFIFKNKPNFFNLGNNCNWTQSCTNQQLYILNLILVGFSHKIELQILDPQIFIYLFISFKVNPFVFWQWNRNLIEIINLKNNNKESHKVYY